ncbi:alcohol dehydrogenase catalytic domain-containing protein [Rhodococcus oxybenzonivorans]|uniref:alcohol dehydrogenase catalytic domain-containing protein n=1 Tax=Rhodococcus oxybenzonivorans TaxID=1990687 RepID=UPI002954CEA6|nr:alcohol dehydrogenase catalytic domain-containing protein [Rhodococcus oxybenzonivorans]MDV7353885.1 alcohol dehydrogenase catalytic domain-containing protein [Rhodococcus oxybenzonivorans]
MKIKGAVLEHSGLPRPYAQSRPLVIEDLDLDPPGPGEVLVRIEAAGICHSDLSVVDGNRRRPVPLLLGHEAAGRIQRLGPAVDDVAIGQRVVMTFLPRCGSCTSCDTNGRLPCSAGSAANNEATLLGGGTRLRRGGTVVNHHLGVSGFATHAVVDRRSVVPLDDDVPADVAAVLGCAVLTGGGAVINAGRPRPGDAVMIVGLGGVGMAALLTALALGNGEVIGVDALPDKLDHARAAGATAYSPQQAAEFNITAPLVVEAAGNARAFETAVAATAPGGTTVTVGLPGPETRAAIAPLDLVSGARTITGSYLGSAVPERDIPLYAQMWREGVLPVEQLITSRIRLSDINSAMDRLADGEAVRQIVIFDRD